MEMWFKRAMDADPDNFEACLSKMYYLEPKWYGSAEDMLKFANECYDGGNWRGRLPLMLADARRRLRFYEPDAAAYLRQPDVWNDIQRAYEPYLRVVPDDVQTRSDYCATACHAAKWNIARAQFQILGPHILPTIFGNGGIEEVNQLRQQAQSATPTSGP
jgi:hypothetical protein